jgi:hypothetical protein
MNPLAVVGVVVDLVGIGVIVAGVLVPGETRWPLIVSGFTLSFIGAVMFVISQKVGRFYGVSPRLLARGQPAFAEVLQARTTATIFMGSPVVAFRLKVSHQAHDYPADVQQAVPRELLGAVLPGSRVGVRVDPEHADRVVIDWSQPPIPARTAPAAAAGEPSGQALVESIPPEHRMSAAGLLARGRRGTARIVAAKELGDAAKLGVIAPGDERAGAMMTVLDLEVKLPGREPYPVKVVHWVPASQVGQAGPGREVVVAVDRDDPEHQVAIDWETPPA